MSTTSRTPSRLAAPPRLQDVLVEVPGPPRLLAFLNLGSLSLRIRLTASRPETPCLCKSVSASWSSRDVNSRKTEDASSFLVLT